MAAKQAKGGVRKRAKSRLEVLGGVKGVSRKGGISVREARRVRKAWMSPKGRAKRAQIEQDATLYNPATLLSGESLREAIDAMVKGEIQPGLNEFDRAIATERGTGAELSKRSGDYYQQIALEAQKSIDASNAIAGKLNTDLEKISGESGQKLATAGQEAQTALAGSPIDSGAKAKLVAELSAQQGRQATDAQAYRSAGAQQGAAGASYANALRGSLAAKGGEIQRDIGNRTQANVSELLSKRGDLAAQEGPLRSKLTVQLRQAGFEQLATQLGLQIDSERLQQEAQLAAADNQLERDRILATIRGQDVAAETQRRGQDVTARGQDLVSADKARDRRLKRALADADDKSGNKTKVERAVGAILSGSFTTKDDRSIPLTTLLKRDPDKWGPKFHAQLQAKYGKQVADAAMRRLRKRYTSGGPSGMLGDVVDAIDEILG